MNARVIDTGLFAFTLTTWLVVMYQVWAWRG